MNKQKIQNVRKTNVGVAVHGNPKIKSNVGVVLLGDPKGITLIALVITIVILIILAGVAINLTLSNNGIFNKAKEGRENYLNAQGEEQESINSLSEQLSSGQFTGGMKEGLVTLNETNGIVSVGNTKTFNIEENISGGEITVKSSNEEIATASIEGTTISITGIAKGTTTIIITSSATSNYNASVANYEITVNELEKWETPTNATYYETYSSDPNELYNYANSSYLQFISNMIEGYYAGTNTPTYLTSNNVITTGETNNVYTIDWGNGITWSIGDKLAVCIDEIPATYVDETQPKQVLELTIIGFFHDNLKTAVNGKTKSFITLETSLLSENGNMNSTYDGNSNAEWRGSLRRSWCNNTFYNKLPNSFKNLVKTVTKYTSICSDPRSASPTNFTTDDKCFLLSYYELTGKLVSSIHSDVAVAADGTQYEYYKTHEIINGWTRSGRYGYNVDNGHGMGYFANRSGSGFGYANWDRQLNIAFCL